MRPYFAVLQSNIAGYPERKIDSKTHIFISQDGFPLVEDFLAGVQLD